MATRFVRKFGIAHNGSRKNVPDDVAEEIVVQSLVEVLQCVSQCTVD